MLRSESVLEFDPHFKELASGRFSPACDPNGNQHTLEKLAIATFEKGKHIPRGNRAVYTPSWAADYSTEVIFIPKKESLVIATPWMVELHGPNRDLSIFDNEEHFIMLSSGLLIDGGPLPEKILRVDNDEEREGSKELVKLALTSFFDTPPAQ